METICRGGRTVEGFALGSDSTDRTITELQDLIAAKDVEMAAIDARVNEAKPDQKLVDDWHALQAKYGAARTAALRVVSTPSASTRPISSRISASCRPRPISWPGPLPARSAR